MLARFGLSATLDQRSITDRFVQKGRSFGRPVKLGPGERMKIASRYANGETLEVLAKDRDVGHSTIWRFLSDG